jgi:hypothetical protein
MTGRSSPLESLIESAFTIAVNEHRNHDALVAAILAYLVLRDTEGTNSAVGVGLLHEATSLFLDRECGVVTDSCSFCGKKPPMVKLSSGGAGEKMVSICNSCVDTFHSCIHRQG